MPSWSAFCVTILGAGGVCLLMLRWLFHRPVLCTCTSQILRHAVITGATSGIGRATAFKLAERNWKLTLGCRDMEAAKQLAEEIKASTNNLQIQVEHLDLTEPNSISRFAESFLPNEVDVLINNAGVMASTPRPVASFSGLDVDIVTNYLGPFYLTYKMIPRLKEVNENLHYPRIIFVSSSLSKKGSADGLLNPFSRLQSEWSSSKAYANSKLAVCLFARELHRRFGVGIGKRLNVYCLFTGGMIHTNLAREIIAGYPAAVQPLLKLASRLLLKSPDTGCQSVIHCAVSSAVPTAHLSDPVTISPDPSGSGLLYRDCVPIQWPNTAQDLRMEQLLWKQTMQLLNLKDS